jgi:branched-chain amino acid transport system permease protein
LPHWIGIPVSTATISHIEFMVFGVMIVLFLIAEPQGLARLWAIGKEKLRIWPFPY